MLLGGTGRRGSAAIIRSSARSPRPPGARRAAPFRQRHDSHGAKDFILRCIAIVRAALPRVSIEVRMDSPFFSHEIVGSLDPRVSSIR